MQKTIASKKAKVVLYNGKHLWFAKNELNSPKLKMLVAQLLDNIGYQIMAQSVLQNKTTVQNGIYFGYKLEEKRILASNNFAEELKKFNLEVAEKTATQRRKIKKETVTFLNLKSLFTFFVENFKCY